MSSSDINSAAPLRTASEGVLRVLFGLFLAIIAIALDFYDSNWFAAVTVLMALLAGREWHRLVRSPAQRAVADNRPIHMQTAVTVFAIGCAVAALLMGAPLAALALLGCGTAAAFVLARLRGDSPLWHAVGVLYIGLPSLALVGLQAHAPRGPTVVLGMFLIVWATDTGAMMFGKMIGGRKLWPAVSPGKTWAGAIGGSVTAAAVFSFYIFFFFGSHMVAAILFAVALSVVGHLGDLFESWVKRRFDTKDSGGIIPGHGGVLDRMDSMFAVSVVLALLVFVGHLNPMFGGQS